MCRIGTHCSILHSYLRRFLASICVHSRERQRTQSSRASPEYRRKGLLTAAVTKALSSQAWKTSIFPLLKLPHPGYAKSKLWSSALTGAVSRGIPRTCLCSSEMHMTS